MITVLTLASLAVTWRTISLAAYPRARLFLTIAALPVSKAVLYPRAQGPCPTLVLQLMTGLAVRPMSELMRSLSCLYSVFSLPAMLPLAGLKVPSRVTYSYKFCFNSYRLSCIKEEKYFLNSSKHRR